MTEHLIRAPIDSILPSFASVLLERGIPGHEEDTLIHGETRITGEPLRALLIASGFIGALNHAVERGLDYDDRWYNQTLCKVNDSVVRLGVMQGEYHWHEHENDDELFFVLEGHFIIDLENRSIDLQAPRLALHA